MEEALAAGIILAGVTFDNAWLWWIGVLMLLLLVVISLLGRKAVTKKKLALRRADENPILKPNSSHGWESEAVFNPAALYENGRVHLLYRALGHDGVSRIGYASSENGIHFDERLPNPVYQMGSPISLLSLVKFRNPFAKKTPLQYDQIAYASGGGWGGSEDPRMVKIEDRIYMTFGIFESWDSMRLGVTSISLDDFNTKRWKWVPHILISPENQRNKNWVLFPEKINGKFAVLHALTPNIMIEYADSLEDLHENPIQSNNHRSGRKGAWDSFVRGAGAPPLKTPHGWLLLYHGMDPDHPDIGYKVGAMLLDFNDPSKILYRSAYPILTPDMPYENDWKAGVVYASGAIIKDGKLFVYYGGGDKTVNVATAPLNEFLAHLMHGEPALLQKT